VFRDIQAKGLRGVALIIIRARAVRPFSGRGWDDESDRDSLDQT
jgi:hypothetical protein